MIHQGSISAYLSKLVVFKVVFESSVNSLPSTAVLEYCSILVKFVCLPKSLLTYSFLSIALEVSLIFIGWVVQPSLAYIIIPNLMVGRRILLGALYLFSSYALHYLTTFRNLLS